MILCLPTLWFVGRSYRNRRWQRVDTLPMTSAVADDYRGANWIWMTVTTVCADEKSRRYSDNNDKPNSKRSFEREDTKTVSESSPSSPSRLFSLTPLTPKMMD